MSQPLEWQQLGQSIIDSHDIRIKAVSALILKAAQVLQGLHVEQDEMITKLRDLLAKSTSLRKKDFNTMMDEVFAQRSEREREVIAALERFGREGETMIAELRSLLGAGDHFRMEEFAKLKAVILTRQKEKERAVAEVLREFHCELQELNAALSKLLSKGEPVTMKDFRSMIKALHLQRKDRQGEMGDMLKELERIREEVSGDWQEVAVRQR